MPKALSVKLYGLDFLLQREKLDLFVQGNDIKKAVF